MTSEGLGEMFEGDSADTCAGKFPLTSMGAERWVSRAQTRERGPHRREQKFHYNSNLLGYPERFNNQHLLESIVFLSTHRQILSFLSFLFFNFVVNFFLRSVAPGSCCWLRFRHDPGCIVNNHVIPS